MLPSPGPNQGPGASLIPHGGLHRMGSERDVVQLNDMPSGSSLMTFQGPNYRSCSLLLLPSTIGAGRTLIRCLTVTVQLQSSRR